MKTKYFISYYFRDEIHKNEGYGRCVFETKDRIKNIVSFVDMEKGLKNKYNFSEVCIINWKEF